MNKRIEILDSTLRDGAQSESISFSLEDKLQIIRALDDIGVRYIEAGNPGSNRQELELFRRVKDMKLKNSRIVAFGSTRRKDARPEDDANCQAIMEAGTRVVTIFGKASMLHVDRILQTTPEENLAMISDTCRYFVENGREVIFDAEHFFDGYKSDREFAMSALRAAADAGAACLSLCDTNGGAFTDELCRTVEDVCREFPDVRIGIHCHNDCGMAVANSVAAVQCGAVHVQGTFLGFGERCGNANLSTIIANLQLKRGFLCIPEENMVSLTHTARNIAEISNTTLHRDVPYVGRSAFAHKAGMHADGVMKCSNSFEHVDPETVGNHRRILTSGMSGRAAILRKIHKVCADVDRDDPVTQDIIEELQRLESFGYQFEGAEGSLELLILKKLGRYKPYFSLVSYKILGEMPYDNEHSSTATLKLRVGENFKITAAEGDGPVNALDLALRESLSEFYPVLKKVHLIDFKVRVMESRDGTAAVVRVLITSTDGDDVWTTIGVSADIIEASWLALVDSVEVRLSRSHVRNKEI